jgi:endonuclease/exonuclease/phosphatase family metal-dependent hydrolase
MTQALQLVEVEGRMPAIPTLIVGDLNTETCWFPGCAILQTCKDVSFPGTDQILDHCVSPTPRSWRIRDHRVVINKDWSDHCPVLYDLDEV